MLVACFYIGKGDGIFNGSDIWDVIKLNSRFEFFSITPDLGISDTKFYVILKDYYEKDYILLRMGKGKKYKRCKFIIKLDLEVKNNPMTIESYSSDILPDNFIGLYINSMEQINTTKQNESKAIELSPYISEILC